MAVLYATFGLLPGLVLGWFGAQWWRRRALRDPIQKHPRGMAEKDPYRLSPAVLTRSEEACYRALLDALPDDCTVLAKVRLADLLQVTYGAADRGEAHSRIGNKALDFLVCNRSLEPKAAIVFTGTARDRAELQTAEFITRVCKKVGLPIVSLPVAAEYSVDEMRRALPAQITAASEPQSSSAIMSSGVATTRG